MGPLCCKVAFPPSVLSVGPLCCKVAFPPAVLSVGPLLGYIQPLGGALGYIQPLGGALGYIQPLHSIQTTHLLRWAQKLFKKKKSCIGTQAKINTSCIIEALLISLMRAHFCDMTSPCPYDLSI